MQAGVAQDGIISPMLFSVYQHAFAIPPRQVGSLRGRHGFHSHDPLASTACHLPGVIFQQPRAVAERIEDHYQCPKECCSGLCKNWSVHPETPTSSALWGANPLGWYCPLSRGDS
jgi:hypothetical protein